MVEVHLRRLEYMVSKGQLFKESELVYSINKTTKIQRGCPWYPASKTQS